MCLYKAEVPTVKHYENPFGGFRFLLGNEPDGRCNEVVDEFAGICSNLRNAAKESKTWGQV
jgi:hypothetical protein